jgi:hypothetical protein
MITKLGQKGDDNFVTLFNDIFCQNFVEQKVTFFDKMGKLFAIFCDKNLSPSTENGDKKVERFTILP